MITLHYKIESARLENIREKEGESNRMRKCENEGERELQEGINIGILKNA